MMTFQEITKILQELKPVLREKYKVDKIALYGSWSRGEHGADSDVDILVELSEPIGLEFVDLADTLQKSLGLKVDLVTKNAVKPRLWELIYKDLKYV